ncbi:hypothetical protein GCM10009119_12140 [Algoriphagus jejuensis]|uniref:SH3b domain-containing protein n=1 Tax=Algoriphagus jejuensis TaxID=419934 RepID=A0ABP3Y9W7_9BACT
MKNAKLLFAFCAAIGLLFTSCNNRPLRIFQSNSARTNYLNALRSAGIDRTKIGRDWHSSAEQALLDAPILEIPASIQGSFKSKSIEARAWTIELEQGATVSVAVRWDARDSSDLIIDFLAGPDWEALESFASQNNTVNLEASRSGQYLIRIQPELLGEGNYQVKVSGTPTYAVFPVQGKNSRAIQSVWGDIRDGGKRSHEGVDIFASRGTPVLAPVAGVVTAVRDRGLGGKQVWLFDRTRNWRLYFAHLDSQLVNQQQVVKPGDTLGLVGNTGNARTTAPHLHFGIYQNGAINPYPAIKDTFEPAPELNPESPPRVMKVKVTKANLRTGPSLRSEVRTTLALETPVFVDAATAEWYQVRTLQGIVGFLSKSGLTPADSIPLSGGKAVALTNLNPLLQDSLSIQLSEFVKLGSGEGYDLIQDRQENLLFLPSRNVLTRLGK